MGLYMTPYIQNYYVSWLEFRECYFILFHVSQVLGVKIKVETMGDPYIDTTN